jgi:hypothetical protein
MRAILHAAASLCVIFSLAIAAPVGEAAAQQTPAAQAQVCDRPANGAPASGQTECCCAAPAKVACCAVAPAGPRKECFADEFRFVLPAPYRASQAIVSADGALVMGPRVTVRAQARGGKYEREFGEVANVGKENMLLGADDIVGSLFSDGKVVLEDGVTVNGPLTAGGALVVPATARLNGKVATNTPVPAAGPTLATVKFSPEADVLAPGGSTRALAPGRYGEVQVEPGGALALRSGTYYMASLRVLSGATLVLDEKDGAVAVFVQTSFTFAGEEKQEGSDGHVLIAAFGCEPTVLLAPFHGTVSAQNAWLAMTAPGKPTFVGRFFANSIEVGADTTIVGLPVTLPPGPVQVSGGQAPLPPAPLPAPPADVGCYVMGPSGWQSVACATQPFIDSHFPRPDAQLGMSTFTSPFKPLAYGQVAVTIPQVGSEQNVFNATNAAQSTSCPSSITTTANTWSVQQNVNDWTIAAGPNKDDSATVQFVTQSDGSTTGICIWQIDVTTQKYPNKCYSPPPSQRSGGLQAFDYGNIAATVEGGKLKMVAQISWVGPGDPNVFAVVDDDTYDMADSWSEVGGGLLGIGNCSEAKLTNAEVVTQVAASTCASDTTATSATCSPPALQPNASAFEGAIGTVETNNLTAIGSPSVAYPNVDLAISSQTATTSGGCLGPSQAYVKDSEKDFGATPSTLGNAVFWESPDIFLVPQGTPVDLNSVSTETTITPGGQFDIWVRVHNDLGCSAVNNAKALVYLADPAALSVQWGPVTMGQYVGDNGGSTGVSVPAGGQALIGPLPFTAPTSGIGDGHRCILAAIKADGEPAPAKPQDAPDSNQVGQRNVEFASPCVFPLTNGTSQGGSAQITLTATPNTGAAPSLTALPDVEVAFDDSDSSWFNVWKTQPGAGTTFKATHSGSVTTIRLGDFSVALNPVPLPAGQSRNATGTTVLPSGYPSALTEQIAATLTETNGSGTVMVQNGGSCVTEPPPVIR